MSRPNSPAARNRRASALSARRVTLALLACMLPWAAWSQDAPDLDWIDRDALAAGEVAVHTDRAERPLTALIKVAVEIDAPAPAIWDVLTACELAPQYVPNVVSCRSLEKLDGGRAELFLQVVKPAFFLPSFEHVFRLDYAPYSRIDVHRVSERLVGMIVRLGAGAALLRARHVEARSTAARAGDSRAGRSRALSLRALRL